MNVEKLIEDGWKKHKAEAGIRSDAGFESFRFGVRHALAAMFPVVDAGDLEEGKFYTCIMNGGDKVCGVYLGYVDGFAVVNDTGDLFERDVESFSEFRRCPTPSELGVG